MEGAAGPSSGAGSGAGGGGWVGIVPSRVLVRMVGNLKL